MKIDRLFVLWADVDGRRHVIGHLARTPDQLTRFWYDRGAELLRTRGFVALPGLEDIAAHVGQEHAYEARYLFSTFAERIPSKLRADAAEMLVSWGVEHPDDQFEILARGGGVRATDRIELAEYRAEDDRLESPLEFRLAGGRHYEPLELRVDERVELQRERDNDFDACATVVIARTGQKAGYVPAQYTRMFAGLLDGGSTLEATAVRRLVLPDAGRWVIRVARDGR